MWCLLQASPLQISPFGAYLLRRPLCPWGYLYPCDTGLRWGGASWLRAAIDRQAWALWAMVLQAPMSQAPMPQAPQMVPPLHQPLTSCRGWPTTPYQQVVQLLSKTTGLGVTFDSSADQHAATGGQDAATHGRPATRGWDDKSGPTSFAKGACKRSSIQMTSKMLHQGVECPSGLQHWGAPCANAVAV